LRGFWQTKASMKKLFAILALGVLTLAAHAALPQPDLIAQIHFAGAQKISADKNCSAFTNEFSSAEAVALRNNAADKLAPWLAGWLQAKLGVTVPGGSTKLRPLLDDLHTAEWRLESRVQADGKPEVVLAIKLAVPRVQIWRDGLKPFFPAATFTEAGGWLVFDSAPGTGRLAGQMVGKISAPGQAWLELDVNWPRLAQWYPKLKELGLPETQLAVTAPDANLRINGKLFFPENLSLALEPWRVPTNTLHQPFDSFTAVRGFSSWLRQQSWAPTYKLSPTPNQLFVWGLPNIPYQTFAAIPVPNAADALNQAYARLRPVFELNKVQFLTPFTLVQTNNEINFRGMPFIAPYLKALTEPAGQFLFAGAFPNTPRSKPLPPELLQRLAEKDLVFYHWEITAERLPQVLNLSQLSLALTSHRQLDGKSAAAIWINKIAPALGNTTTEIALSGPAEMTFARKAPGGFTAFELFALASWLAADDFPHFNLNPPPRPARFNRLHPKVPGAMPMPAPAPPR
jgi:hypothetical protein